MRSFSFLFAFAFLGSSALAQQFDPRLLCKDGATVLEGVRRVRDGGVTVGLGVTPSGENLPALWAPSGTTLLPLLPGDDAGEAGGFDGVSLVVGTSSDVVQMGTLIQIFDRAAAWQDGAPVAIEDLVLSGPPLELLSAVDVDSSGRIVGTGRDASIPALRPWILEGGLLTQLGSLTPNGSAFASDLNELGQVAGIADADGGRDHAVLWQGGTLTDLHVTGGVPGVTSRAFALNDSGTVVGSAEFDVGGPQWERAAIWEGGIVSPLPDLGGGESWAFGINAQGDVVGASTRPDFALRATLWRGGALHDLNDLIPPASGWILLTARGIGDDGRIVGEGAFGGATRGYVLEPLCESCTSYCISTPNSTGMAALISVEGWESVAANLFELVAEPVPNQPGIFYFGGQEALAPFGNGFRCVVSGGFGLFRLPVTVASGNVMRTALEFGAPPASQILPGSTWKFQAWFRDPAAGGAGFDLSDGLSATFVP